MQPQKLVNASVGETIMLQCSAKSYGSINNLKYHWFKLADGDTKVTINGANSSKFVIDHITSNDDSTLYQCGATNENGTTFSRVARINSKT